MRPVRVAVIDEHEIFRKGISSCLAEDPTLQVVMDITAEHFAESAEFVDVAVVSAQVAAQERFGCPLVVCGGGGAAPPVPSGNEVMAVLPRASLTPEQLIGAVHAAAAGLRIGDGFGERRAERLDDRRLQVLRLLADGADTLEISRHLSYSERTIKGLIQDIQRELGARNRAQAVAHGIRQGFI
jgi:DNA-binding NarL/FixJ family response regulator